MSRFLVRQTIDLSLVIEATTPEAARRIADSIPDCDWDTFTRSGLEVEPEDLSDRPTKHTPGPWHVEPLEGEEAFALVICTPEVGHIARVEREDGLAPMDAADAELIADAPAMLEALAGCVTEPGAHCLTYGTDTPKLRRRIEAINAIARAILARHGAI
jgi:hypothetical protein